jgi:flavin-dependent dehydrogenase
LKSHYLPVRKNGAPIYCERVLLIGDAAGLVDPFTGEGIYNAIRSACIAAPIVAQSLQTGNVDLIRYQEAIDRELMPELKASRAFSKIYAWFPGLYFDAVKGSYRFWRAHCRVLRGERSYVSIKKKLGVFQFLVDLFSR